MKSFIPFLVCWLLASVQIYAQQVWPGDINDDGIVNNDDLLYWSFAQNAVGPPRADADSSWAAQSLPDSLLWSEHFPDSLNYAYADCNGDGIVDFSDSIVIRNNYWLRQDSVIVDNYIEGIPTVDPLLSIAIEDSTAVSGQQVNLSINLGEDSLGVDSLFGFSFTARFPPDLIQDIGDNEGFDFNFSPENWIEDVGNIGFDFFIHVDRIEGILSCAIYRKEGYSPVSGSDKLGYFSIVIEDIIFSAIPIDLDSAQYYNYNFVKKSLSIDGATIHNADSIQTQQNQPENDDDEVLDNVFDYDNSLNLYPNPSSGFILMELQDGGQQQIENVKVYSIEGTEMMEMEMEEPTNQTQLQMNEYEPGLYFIKVRTQDGYIIKRMILSPDDTSTGQF